VNVAGCLFENSVSKASEEREALPCAGVRGERPRRDGDPRKEFGGETVCIKQQMNDNNCYRRGGRRVIVSESFHSSEGPECVGAGIEIVHRVIVVALLLRRGNVTLYSRSSIESLRFPFSGHLCLLICISPLFPYYFLEEHTASVNSTTLLRASNPNIPPMHEDTQDQTPKIHSDGNADLD
jgi:hypothetical protein